MMLNLKPSTKSLYSIAGFLPMSFCAANLLHSYLEKRWLRNRKTYDHFGGANSMT